MIKFLESISEIIGWIRIFITPVIIGLIISLVLYNSNPNTLNTIIAISIFVISVIIGVIIATKIYKSKNGTIWFLSRTIASSDLDNEKGK